MPQLLNRETTQLLDTCISSAPRDDNNSGVPVGCIQFIFTNTFCFLELNDNFIKQSTVNLFAQITSVFSFLADAYLFKIIELSNKLSTETKR